MNPQIKNMIDNNFVVKKEERKEYPPIPKNIYQAEILEIEMKEATGQYSQPGDKNFSFKFTLLAGKDEEKKDLRGRNIWCNFVPTTLYISIKHGKNMLYKIVEAVLERNLTREEEAVGLSGQFINSLIGKQCRISVSADIKGDKIYNNVKDCFAKETDMSPLSAKEKETAKVKVKKVEEPTINDINEPEINVDEIPFG